MNKYKIVSILIASTLIATAAYSQEYPGKPPIKTVSGTVINVDFVGNTIAIQSGDGRQMSFSVPGSTTIVQNTHNIGLMDIKPGHPVTIQYDVLSPGKNSVDSIVDNNPLAHE